MRDLGIELHWIASRAGDARPEAASLRGRSLQVHFWVDTQGRVTRVRVEPEIKDAAYRAQFVALLREYVFEPARKLDGTRVDGETTITITL